MPRHSVTADIAEQIEIEIEIEIDIVEPALADDPAVALTRRQHVADKQQIEFAALGGAREAAVVIDANGLARVHRRMAPAGDVVTGRVGKQPEMQLTLHGAAPSYWLTGRVKPK
jgi:hypothetical protein